MARLVKRLGVFLTALGGAALAAIFVIVLINGSWPDFLEPVQARFRLLTAFVGGLSLPIEVLVFVSPGLLVMQLGTLLERKAASPTSN